MDDHITIDYLIAANHAEIANGLLYVSGGGFTDIYRPKLEPSSYLNIFSVALSLAIPWDETNRLHTISVRVEKLEDMFVLSETHASMNISRPPTLPEGVELHVTATVAFNIVFPEPSDYQIVATVDTEGDSKKWRFRVHDVAMGP